MPFTRHTLSDCIYSSYLIIMRSDQCASVPGTHCLLCAAARADFICRGRPSRTSPQIHRKGHDDLLSLVVSDATHVKNAVIRLAHTPVVGSDVRRIGRVCLVSLRALLGDAESIEPAVKGSAADSKLLRGGGLVAADLS